MKKIIVGLGNPGEEYEDTYHSVGRKAIDEITNYQLPITKPYKHLFEYAEIDGMVLVKPLVFMNESGKAVREALKKFGVKPEALTIIQDDSDLTIGAFKISFARNSGGHRGIQSIIDHLKTNEFSRIRIGIRPRREAARKKAGEFVLAKITPSDKKRLAKVFEEIKPLILG